MDDKKEDYSCSSSHKKPNFYLEIKFPSIKGGHVFVWDSIYYLLECHDKIKKGSIVMG